MLDEGRDVHLHSPITGLAGRTIVQRDGALAAPFPKEPPCRPSRPVKNLFLILLQHFSTSASSIRGHVLKTHCDLGGRSRQSKPAFPHLSPNSPPHTMTTFWSRGNSGATQHFWHLGDCTHITKTAELLPHEMGKPPWVQGLTVPFAFQYNPSYGHQKISFLRADSPPILQQFSYLQT